MGLAVAAPSYQAFQVSSSPPILRRPDRAAHGALQPGWSAFTDKSSWDKVARLLRQKGFKVTEVDIPLTSLEADVAVTRHWSKSAHPWSLIDTQFFVVIEAPCPGFEFGKDPPLPDHDSRKQNC
jgi:hypothetical protein